MLEYLGTFNFNGRGSEEFGLFVKEKRTRKSPARDMRAVPVPGRSGDVYIDNGRFENIPIDYVMRSPDFKATDFSALAYWLGAAGYKRLTDSEDATHYRLARCTSGQDWKDLGHNFADIPISFDCAPFRYLLSGEKPIEIKTKGTRITNPTMFVSYPYIKIEGSGAVTLYIGDGSFHITKIDGYIELNCEDQHAYKGTEPRANVADFDEFPTLRPDWNGISWAGNVTKITVIPHWREL